MEVVSSDPEDVERHRLGHEVRWAARSLLANLLRVSRGAGKPQDIEEQLNKLHFAIEDLRSARPREPIGFLLASALDISREYTGSEERNRRWQHAQDTIVHGAMQVIASRLVEQRTQESAGTAEMMNGLREIEEIRAENQKAVRARVPGNLSRRSIDRLLRDL